MAWFQINDDQWEVKLQDELKSLGIVRVWLIEQFEECSSRVPSFGKEIDFRTIRSRINTASVRRVSLDRSNKLIVFLPISLCQEEPAAR